ncbi:MAG: SMP-30/gluconolactonase/LRE family protein [Pseudohongiellaceae bacterium]
MNRLEKSLTGLLTALALGGCAAGDGQPGSEPRLLADGFAFTEGPIADADGNIYFSDIPNNRIHYWSTTEEELSLFRANTMGANGLFFGPDGHLHAAEGGGARITRMDDLARTEILVNRHDNRPFNSPNDLWIDDDGGIYFTDPRYGNESNLPQPGYFVYYLPPDGDTAHPIITDLERPNGIIGTPDGETLYVADHGGDQTWAYDIEAPGQVASPVLAAGQGSDGVTLDSQGHLYLTGGNHVSVYDPQTGERLDQIEFPEAPSNMTFGGPDRRTLFVTARTGFYSIPMDVRGAY